MRLSLGGFEMLGHRGLVAVECWKKQAQSRPCRCAGCLELQSNGFERQMDEYFGGYDGIWRSCISCEVSITLIHMQNCCWVKERHANRTADRRRNIYKGPAESGLSGGTLFQSHDDDTVIEPWKFSTLKKAKVGDVLPKLYNSDCCCVVHHGLFALLISPPSLYQ